MYGKDRELHQTKCNQINQSTQVKVKSCKIHEIPILYKRGLFKAKASAPIYPFLSWSLKDSRIIVYFFAKRWTNGVPWSRLEQLLSTSACVRPLRRATIPPGTAFFLAVSSAPILLLLNGGIFYFFHKYISGL